MTGTMKGNILLAVHSCKVGMYGLGSERENKKGREEGRLGGGSTIFEGNLACKDSISNSDQSLDYSGPLLLYSVIHPVGQHLCPAHLSVLRVVFCNDLQPILLHFKMQPKMIPVHHLTQLIRQLL